MDHRRPAVELPFLGRLDPQTGRKLCGWCGTPVSGRRISWCSDACVQDYLIAKGNQSACRKHCWAKDRGVCQECRTDVNKHRRALVAKFGDVPANQRDRIKWEADHIVPLVEGGEHKAANLRTLCRHCHKAATRALRARMAERKQAGA